jgi:orotidine-5'-phosphate decarboxylase
MSFQPRRQIEDRVIVALDVDNRADAIRLVSALRGDFSAVKVGMELFHAEGKEIFHILKEEGVGRIFYDCKLHDIETTVAKTLKIIDQYGIWMTNIHATMGLPTLRVAREAMEHTLLLGMTVLSSTPAGITSQCDLLSERSVLARLDGVIVPASCVSHVRHMLGNLPLIVTPGMRLPGDPADEHKQKMTPSQALSAGSDFVVVGRTLTRYAPGDYGWMCALHSLKEDLALAGEPKCS